MDKKNDKVQQIVVKQLLPILNGNLQISDKVVEDIASETKADESFIEAMKKVAEWFNRHNVGMKSPGEQKPYIGVCLNLLTLLAAGDITGLVENWVLSDME